MKGMVVFYINYNPNDGVDVEQMIDKIKMINAPLLKRIEEENGYQVAFVPATNESCRVEKIDYELN